MDHRRVAIIAGGTYGIGRAITLAFARARYAVVAFGNDAAQAAGTQAALLADGLSAETLEGDVAHPADIRGAAAYAIEQHGRVDVLCNNAAIRPVGTILETEEEDWDRCFAVNVKGTFLFSRAVLPQMIAQGGGVIINTASASGYGGKAHIAYCASKGAIFAFTKSLAIDHLKDHVRVNAIVPGFTLSGMTEGFAGERIAASVERNVMGRLRRPEDIAEAVCFLASDAAATVTGATWEVGVLEGQMVM